jgi:uncharacterized membrane protein
MKGLNMWGCNFIGNIPFFNHFFSQGIFSFLFLGAVLVIVITMVSKILRKRSMKVTKNDHIDSLELLKIRFAKGEIDKDEFLRMKQILRQS